MHHSITLENFGVRLRPVRLTDAAFIVWLRNLDHAKGRIGDSAQDIASQEQWLQTYFARDGDYYFLVETSGGIPLGTYGLYKTKSDEWESGRWIIRPGVPAAIPSIALGFEAAFDCLGISKLKAYTVSSNQRVLTLNGKLGFKPTGCMQTQRIEGASVQLLEFELHLSDWLEIRELILPLARLAGKNVCSWEQSKASRSMAS
ncbi:MAG: GNAT family protein [Verrucomicrobiota bacterium]